MAFPFGQCPLNILKALMRFSFPGRKVFASLDSRNIREWGHPLKGPLSREKAPLWQGKDRFLAEGTAVLRTASVSACSSPLPVFLSGGVGSFFTAPVTHQDQGTDLKGPAPSAYCGPENLRFHAVSKWSCTDLMVFNQPLGGSRHGRQRVRLTGSVG